MQKIIFTFFLSVFLHSIILAVTQINPCEFVRPGTPKEVGFIFSGLSNSLNPFNEQRAHIKEELMGIEYKSDLDRCPGEYQAYTRIMASGSIDVTANPDGLFFVDHAQASGYIRVQVGNDTILDQSISITDTLVSLPVSYSVSVGGGVQGSASWTPTWSVANHVNKPFDANVGYIETPAGTWIDHPPKEKISYTKTVVAIMGISAVKTGLAYAYTNIESPTGYLVKHENGTVPLKPLMTFRSKP